MPRSASAVIPLLLCVFLTGTGCGGGGGSTTSTPPPTGATNPTPTIASVTPSTANAGDAATAITVTGSDFISSSAIQWNGTALATTFASSTSLQATIPASDLANGIAAKLTVENPSPGGGTSAALTFTVNNPVPAIVSITPPNATAGSADLPIAVSGNGFVPSTELMWNGAALTTTVVSATQLTSTIPAANLTLGTEATITAQNLSPKGGTSPGVKFDVKGPTALITSISPRLIHPGSAATTVTVTGVGFTNSSVVLWNSSPRPTTFVSATQLQVVLSAADLQTAQLGMIQVSNPGPGAAPSTPIGLAVSADSLPTIQNVSVANVQGVTTPCPKQLSATITGTNLSFAPVIAANGVALSTGLFVSGPPQQVSGYIPVGFTAKPGALSFTVTVTSFDLVQLTSDPFAYPSAAPAALSVCANPSPATVFPSTTFSFAIQPSEVNISGNATVSLGTLPSGVSATTSTIPVPPAGSQAHLKTSSTIPAGNYDLSFTATAGSTTATSDFGFTVASPTGLALSFQPINFDNEVGVPIGGSGSITYFVLPPLSSPNGPVIFDVTPSLSTLPPGTTATFSPATVGVGQSLTVTLSASSNAPVTKNAAITLTGTPLAPIPVATTQFFADVTQPPGSLPNSRTDFVGTVSKPFGAAFDPVHNLIFASNPDWNRVDVISNATHKIVKSIPVPGARAIDVSPDFKHAWAETASSQLYEIDTTTLQATHFTLPASVISSTGLPPAFGNDAVFALSDGTVFIASSGASGTSGYGIYNPQTNQFTVTSANIAFPRRSGDGTHVYLSTVNALSRYDVSTHSTVAVGPIPANSTIAGVNSDGSRFVLNVQNAAQLYDDHLNVLGSLPGVFLGVSFQFQVVFSSDNSKLYEITAYNNVAAVLTLDASTLNVLGVAPAETASPSASSGTTGAATPFAIDSTGMLLGILNLGIAFDDSTFHQTYASNQPPFNSGIPGFETYGGPLAGGTVSSFNATPPITPDAWFGATRGSADTSRGELTFTSPPSSAAGPVNLKLIYPNGLQAFYPQLFAYGVTPEFASTSGSSPDGGAPASIVGFGLPQDASGGSVTVGSNQATITTTAGQYAPLVDDGSESTILNYTFPPGNPGHSDLQVTTPNGTGSLPKAIVYAKTVTDYSSSDTFNTVLLDARRHQLYLSAGDHVDVFSTTTNQFLAALHPAAQGASRQFAGMALTPDGSQLLVTNVTDGSLAVINPDSPSTTFAIPVVAAAIDGNGCAVGPIYVAATSNNLAFVQSGSLPHPSCTPQGFIYITNLLTRSSVPLTAGQCGVGVGVDASADGLFAALGSLPCVYSVQTGNYAPGAFPVYYGNFGVGISGDGNVIAETQVLGDINVNIVGVIPHPIPLYGSPTQLNPPIPFLNSRLNASGSLLFTAYPTYFEIIDVAHGTLRTRFSLTESIQNVAAPLAIDSGGRFVYLITDKGLTVADFGESPLSIGHLNPQTAAVGTQVTVRGSGFDSSVTATVGGVAATVSVTDENTLTLTIPAVSAGPQDIVLTRTGTYAETYTLENGIVLQ